ncbi:MAG: SufE family protein [Verrucomicrobia bacterium]|nr:SufE family protein [Verrucomicrobiota bacterium]
MSLAEKQTALAAELSPFGNAQERLAWLVEQARQRPPLPAAARVDANRVEGCLSKLWFVPEFRDGRCWFSSESDSLIVKAVAGLLCDFYSGEPAAEIAGHPPDFLRALGITQHLSPNRRNGLALVWKKIHAFAQQHAP